MMSTKSQNKSSAVNAYTEKRVTPRIKAGDVINGTTVDPVLRSYLPFKAKVVDISDSGIQLAVKKGSVNMSEGTKVIVMPPKMQQVSSSSKEAVVIWSNDKGSLVVFGCMFL